MRVAIVTLYPNDPRRIPGGIRMVSYNLVQGLRRYPDLELHVVHCHSDIAAEMDCVETLEEASSSLSDRVSLAPSNVSTPHDGDRQFGDVVLHFMAMPRQRLVPNLMTSVGRVRRMLRAIRPDLVHAHVAQYAYAAATAGYPTIYTIHGVLAREREIYRDTLFDRLRYGLLAHYETLALPRVDRLVAISPYVREAYAHREGCRVETRRSMQGEARWERIDNPVPQAFFDVERHPEPGRVLYAGSITEVKDLLTLLRAVERLKGAYPAVRLRIAGRSTSDTYERNVHAFVEQHGLQETVAFLGLLDRQQLLDEYARCAALALPSLVENAPMVVIEAMAAGAPVVATRVGGVPDLVVEGESGYMVPAGDDAALAERLLMLLRDESLGARLGARGRELARARFHVDRVARAYYELYLKTVRENKR